QLGALSSDDFEEIKGMTSPYEIVGKLVEVIERENLVAKVALDSISGQNHYVNLLGFEYQKEQHKQDEPKANESATEQESNNEEAKEEPTEAQAKGDSALDTVSIVVMMIYHFSKIVYNEYCKRFNNPLALPLLLIKR